MNIICTICRDNFVQSDDISVTSCGHMFHLNCLSRWLVRSNSCPECRKKTSQEKTQRLYVTFATNETNSADNLSMQERIDSLKFQVLLNERNIKYYTSKNETLLKQNIGLRQEVRKVESEINKKNSQIFILKEYMRDLKERFTEHESLKHKLSQKEKEIEHLQCIKKLLHGSVVDAEKVIKKTDHNTLVTYMNVMKRDMSRNAEQWELLYKYIKKCLITLKEIAPLVKDHFKGIETTNNKLLDNVICLQTQIYRMGNVGMTGLKVCQLFNKESSISNSTKKLNENFCVDVEEIEIVPSKTNARQETGNLNSLSLNAEIEETVTSAVSSKTDTRQEIESMNNVCSNTVTRKTVNNANQDKCPISKKRAKLS